METTIASRRSALDRRVELYQEQLGILGVDLAVIDQAEHVAYLTGYAPGGSKYQALLVPADGEPLLVGREMDRAVVEAAAPILAAEYFDDATDPVSFVRDVLRRLLKAGDCLGLGLGSNYLPARDATKLANGVADVRVVDVTDLLWEQRLIKDDAEIDLIRRAAAMADTMLEKCATVAAPGVTERDVLAELTALGLRLGADNQRLVLMNSGRGANVFHAPVTERDLRLGDVLHVECIPQVSGYAARLMRPVVIGPVSTEMRDVAEALCAIQDAQMAAIAPGAEAADIDRMTRAALVESGLVTEYSYNTGYTLGLMGVPRTSDMTRAFTPSADWTVTQGMVFHLFLGAQGMAFSETVVVRESGVERLTRAPREVVATSTR